MKPYDHRNCLSLFGYARQVHIRFGATCALCGLSAGEPPNPAIYRQLSIEHIIGASQGGYSDQIREAVRERFSWMTRSEQDQLTSEIHDANTVTACAFCNSATSRMTHSRPMQEMILEAHGEPEDVLASVQDELKSILQHKQLRIEWILNSVDSAFYTEVAPDLQIPKSRGSGRAGISESKNLASHAATWPEGDEALECEAEDDEILRRFWARMEWMSR